MPIFRPTAFVAVLLTTVLASTASARTFIWEMTADESQVANSGQGDGSTDSTAIGHAALSYETGTKTLSYDIEWEGLEGDLTAIHVHGPAGVGQSNRAHVFNVFTSEVDVLESGLDRTTDSVQEQVKLKDLVLDTRSPFGPGQVLRFMLEDRGYVNIHSNLWPMGEIRADFVLTEGEIRTGTDSQDRCSNTASASFATIAKREAKEIGDCISEAAAGNLSEDLGECFEGDPRGKIRKEIESVDPKLDKHCRGFDSKGFNEYPFFGVPDFGAVLEMGASPETGSVEALIYEQADEASIAMAEDLFGEDLDAALVGGVAADQSCQAAAWKRARKCQLRLVEGYGICKKRGLKGGKAAKLYEGASDEPFASDTDLEPCIGFDPDGSVAAACSVAEITERLSDACDEADFSDAFPGIDPAMGVGDVATAVSQRTACRTCEALNAVNGMSADCDLADDDSDNDSCDSND